MKFEIDIAPPPPFLEGNTDLNIEWSLYVMLTTQGFCVLSKQDEGIKTDAQLTNLFILLACGMI